jgi:hypothetical protein
VYDSSLRLVQWNLPFQRGIGIGLRQNLPLDTMLRAQAEIRLFDPGVNIEAEIGRRLAVLRSGDATGVPHPGPGGETLILRGLPIGEAGLIVLLNGLGSWHPSPAPPPPSQIEDQPMVPEAATSPSIEW